MTRRFALTVAAALFFPGASPLPAQDAISVMTQYPGADLPPIIAAPDPIAFDNAVSDALIEVAANDVRVQAELFAGQIARLRG